MGFVIIQKTGFFLKRLRMIESDTDRMEVSVKGQLYSFDIYDTLITRKTATPEGIFALMQKQLEELREYQSLPKRLIQNFFIIRIQAEKVARNTYITGDIYDITLAQIYECVRLTSALSQEQTTKLMQLEIETEFNNSLPITQNIEKVKDLIKNGERVVLISNMYLTTDSIRRILIHMDSVFQEITIYVSGDIGKTKGTKTLYEYVQKQEAIEFSNWYHYGDNKVLDVDIPNSMGICAELFPVSALYEWEKDILQGRENNADLQIMLGISRRVNKGMKTPFAYQVGTGYSAEILLPYVLWILQESMKKGIQKLFFIARDGYILKKIADILIEKYRYPITTVYLYGSRKAWRLPSIKPKGFDLQEFFRWNYPRQIYTYQRFAEILGLTIEELRRFLPFIKDIQSELSSSFVQEIIKILIEQQEQIAALICQKYKEQNIAAVSYLNQEIGNENKLFAFVDLIGSGYTQKCLADLIQHFYSEPIRTFFYRLDNCKASDKNFNDAFFPNRIKMGNVIEVLCGAPHGQTNGYKYSDGSWVPLFGEDEGQKLASYGFEDYKEGIETYTKEFVTCFPNEPFILQNLEVLELYFNYMAEAKNRNFYDYIADMPYGITGHEKIVASFAPRISDKQLSQIFLWHKGEPIKKYYTGYSLEFSLARLSNRQKKKHQFYNKHSDDAIIKWLRIRMFLSKRNICSHRYELIADQIVLYGAGKKGRKLHEQLTLGKQFHANIALWVDKNYEKYSEEGLDIQPPENIWRVDYKQIVIAVASQKMAEEIKESLVSAGIESFKILWICTDDRIG